MAAGPATISAQERPLLAAAREGDEDGVPRGSSSPTAASCTRTATGCSARSTTPRTRCRTRCCAPGAALARFEGRSSLRSWLYTIATNTSLNLIARRPKRVLPIDYGPAADPHGGPGEPVAESVWMEPYADDTLGLQGRAGRPGGPLRAARERRARLRRRAAAPARQPARRAHPARGARLLGQGDRRDARDDRRLGQQRAAARARDRRGAPARAEPAGHAARAGRRAPQRDRRGLHEGLGALRRRRRRRDAHRGRVLLHAAAGHLVRRRATRSRPSSPAGRCRASGAGSRAGARQRPGGARLLQLGRRTRRRYIPFALNVLDLPRRARSATSPPSSSAPRPRTTTARSSRACPSSPPSTLRLLAAFEHFGVPERLN